MSRFVPVASILATIAVTRDEGTLRVVPFLAGAYKVSIDGSKELRVAAPLAREIDLRPRSVTPTSTSSALGGGVAIVDVSWMVALGLLALVAAELLMRALSNRPRFADESKPAA